MKIKKTYTSIPLIGIWFFILLTILPNRGTTAGEFILFTAFFVLNYIILFIGIIIISIVRLIKKKEKFNFLPVIVSLIVIVSVIFSFNYAYDVYHSPDILSAENRNLHKYSPYVSLKIREDSTYKIEMLFVEVTNNFYGHYKLKGDTIYLRDHILMRTDSIFFDKYLIQKSGSYLLPMLENKFVDDSTKCMDLVFY
jgi:hypothetical protein